MTTYQVQRQDNKVVDIILVEQNDNEHEFPMTFSTDPNDKDDWEPLIGKIIGENAFVTEEHMINDEEEGDEIYLLVAKLKK